MATIPNEYYEYSALDAPTYLLNILHYYFTSDSNKYKFTKARLAYNDVCKNNDFATARKLFDIITGTNLVTKKTVTSFKSTQGQRYLIRKDYYQNVQRMLRTERRSQAKAPKPFSPPSQRPHTPCTTSTKKSPFLQAITDLQDTSDEDTDTANNASTVRSPSPNLLADVKHTPKATNIPTTPTNEESIESDVEQHASDLEQNMDRALKDLIQDDDEHTANEHINQIINEAVAIKIDPIVNRLIEREELLKQHAIRYEQMTADLTTLVQSTKALHSTVNQQHDKFLDKLSFLHRKTSECETFLNTVLQSEKELTETIVQKIHDKMPSQTTTTPTSNVVDLESKFKRRLT